MDGYVQRALKAKAAPVAPKGSKGKTNFLDELARHEEVGADRIRDEALNVLLAGRDTSECWAGSLSSLSIGAIC